MAPGSQRKMAIDIVYLGLEEWSITVSKLNRTEAQIVLAALLKEAPTSVVALAWRPKEE